jgi:hypothetical protein
MKFSPPPEAKAIRLPLRTSPLKGLKDEYVTFWSAFSAHVWQTSRGASAPGDSHQKRVCYAACSDYTLEGSITHEI